MRNDHADAFAPFVIFAGDCTSFAGTDALSTGGAVVTGFCFTVLAFALIGGSFAAIGDITVAIDVVGEAARASSSGTGDVGGAFDAATAAVIGIVLDVVAETVTASGFSGAVDTFSIDAVSVFTAGVSA